LWQPLASNPPPWAKALVPANPVNTMSQALRILPSLAKELCWFLYQVDLISGLFQDEHIMISEKIIISVDSDFFAAYLAEYGQTAVHVPRHDSEICKAISSEFDSTFSVDESNS
jgi:hypothetical protein